MKENSSERWKGLQRYQERNSVISSVLLPEKEKTQSILLTWIRLNVSVIWDKAVMDTQERQLSHEHFVVMISLKREALARCWTWTEREDFGKFNISTLCNTALHTNIGFSIYPDTFLRVHNVTFILKHYVQESHIFLTWWIRCTLKEMYHYQRKQETKWFLCTGAFLNRCCCLSDVASHTWQKYTDWSERRYQEWHNITFYIQQSCKLFSQTDLSEIKY